MPVIDEIIDLKEVNEISNWREKRYLKIHSPSNTGRAAVFEVSKLIALFYMQYESYSKGRYGNRDGDGDNNSIK